MSRAQAGPLELAVLRGWLRAAKGKLTFDSLARRAGKRGVAVSACTLRRALDGRLPTERTVVAFARGAGSDEDTARQVWAAAAAAVRAQPNRPRFPQVPGRITTGAGLVRAMRRVREAAGSPSLRRLVAAPQAEGLLRRSTLHLALTGRRLPSEQLLTAFAAACSAGEETADALVAARRRILAGPRPLPAYPCDAVEEAEDRRLRDAAARPWLADEDEEELDWYERHLVDEEDAEYRRLAAWVDDLTAEELNELQQPTGELNAGREAEPR
ncbi:hypothetical protein ACFY1B_45965 [Streptomyces mirabilis]|uniref:hypothetical protein n=1 Tax=Streptomyces mirabilis TaxID=68239 RepID=UPI0036B7476C